MTFIDKIYTSFAFLMISSDRIINLILSVVGIAKMEVH